MFQLFMVVHNVKRAHECQEYGETQEFTDDIEYIMDGLHDGQHVSTRCLRSADLTCFGRLVKLSNVFGLLV